MTTFWKGFVKAGPDKYKAEYRRLKWKELSALVRERDGSCVRCGSIEGLEADHFHPSCYRWIKSFFNPNKIQTLCAACHRLLPSMKKRCKDWESYRFLERTR